MRWMALHAVGVVAFLMLAACGDDRGLDSCAPLTMADCTCEDGREGMMTCRSDRTFSPCRCGAETWDAGTTADGGRDLGPGGDLGLGPDLGRDGGGIIVLPDFGRDMYVPSCGNGRCDSATENAASCPDDCPPVCGDGYCLSGEEATCPSDCDCSVDGVDGCAFDARCFPTHRSADYARRGACIPTGTGTEGASCADQLGCGEDLICQGTSGANLCGELCDPLSRLSGAGACPTAGEGCFPFAEYVVGVCRASCTPMTTTGCPSGQWCAPSMISADAGECRVVGTIALGGVCSDSTDCVANAFCSSAGLCEPFCDPAAGGSTCPSGLTCIATPIYDEASGNIFLSSVGTCEEVCDFDGTGTCSGGTCVAEEVLATSQDICLDVPDLADGSTCAFSGAAEKDLCNGLGACYDVGTGLECLGFCRASYGAFGGSHPDCGTGETCQGTAGDSLGLCR